MDRSPLRRHNLACVACFAFACATVTAGGRSADAAEIRLKDGTVVRGVTIDKLDTLEIKPPKRKDVKDEKIVIYPIYIVKSPLKHVFVPRAQVDVLDPKADLGRPGGFNIDQHKNGGPTIGTVQGYVKNPGPFDEFGRRTVMLKLANGPTPVFQGITAITPEFANLSALNFKWDSVIPTSSIPFSQLDAILRKNADPNDPKERLKIAAFYIQASYFAQAEQELLAIEKQSSELAPTAADMRKKLQVAKSQEFLRELKLRRAAGQYALAYELCKQFPVENVEPTTLREVRDLMKEHEQALERIESARSNFGALQGLLKNDPRAQDVAPIRAEITEKLNEANLERLDAYFKLSGDAQLKPDEKLALALSGWVVGSANAVTELDQALRFWQARFLLLDYLNSATDAAAERKLLLTKLQALEGVGPDRVAQMLPLLPSAGDTAGIAPGQAVHITVPVGDSGEEFSYWVTLPSEYHADRRYPLIVALHSERGTPQQELQGFWGGNEEQLGHSQRYGYVAIAPDYISGANAGKGYDYGEASHQIVLASLRDALRRYNIDADRVFLSGHGMGGDAAWDMGLSHPYLFAGVIPINGAIDRYAPYYLDNGKSLAFYTLAGQMDEDLKLRNAKPLTTLFTNGVDLIHTEYRGSGPESFYSEIQALFEWMSRLRRAPPPRTIDVRTLRETDTSFSWFEFSGIPENMKGIDGKNRQRAVHPLIVSARITPANMISVPQARAARYRFWLPRGGDLIDFNKRLKVDINGKQKWNDFVKPDLGAMLERVRTTGDRQHLAWALMEFEK